ncbi:MAG: response regulator, partial [Bacteroidota bacterium]
ILIKDNGIGISSEKLTNIFDPYYQIDNIEINPKRKGSGIGLALCKNIIKDHHGDIMVSSDENGTVFTIRLIKGKDHYKESDFCSEQIISERNSTKLIVESEEKYNNDENLNPDFMNSSISILLVEDNIEARKLLKSIFQPNYKIFEAEDGEAGVKIAIEEQPFLIISDVMMPKLSGIQLCTILKRNIQTSHIPIILLTAKATEEFEIEGLEIGADDYITKPFNTKLLKAKVKNIIQNRLLLQQKFRSDPNIEITEVTSSIIDQKFIKRAREIVEKNIDNTEFITQDFAYEMGIGRSKLFDKIKGITGMTPNDFILSVRLTKAAKMLINVNEEKNISEIAYSVGFSTASYFSRCFRQYFGVTPSNYGASIKKEE